jgi:hypothetical protein
MYKALGFTPRKQNSKMCYKFKLMWTDKIKFQGKGVEKYMQGVFDNLLL